MNENKLYDNLYRWAIDGIGLTIIIDKQGIVRHIGKLYAEILGLPVEDIIGQPVTTIVPNSEMLQIMETGKPEYGSIFVMKNKMPIIVNRLPICDEEGNIQGAICITCIAELSILKRLYSETRSLQSEQNRCCPQLEALTSSFPIDSIIGASPSIEYVKNLVEKVADSDITVLFTGETGTGKEVFANALHQLSKRSHKNYVKVNCAAIPKDLFESELFGYKEGAFSGAKKGGQQGKFELANNGTILLDEIGEIPFALQAKLLRVLQEREVMPLGALKPMKLNVRIICSTNQDLIQMVKEGRFRKDLYYRINIMEIQIPPLRERSGDIPLLCDQFVQEANIRYGCHIDGISKEVKELLIHYNWPGNVRELKHTLERACIMKVAGELDLENCDFFMRRVSKMQNAENRTDTLPEKKGDLEQRAILEAMSRTGGNKTQAAKLLGISRSVLYEKMKHFQI